MENNEGLAGECKVGSAGWGEQGCLLTVTARGVKDTRA